MQLAITFARDTILRLDSTVVDTGSAMIIRAFVSKAGWEAHVTCVVAPETAQDTVDVTWRPVHVRVRMDTTTQHYKTTAPCRRSALMAVQGTEYAFRAQLEDLEHVTVIMATRMSL